MVARASQKHLIDFVKMQKLTDYVHPLYAASRIWKVRQSTTIYRYQIVTNNYKTFEGVIIMQIYLSISVSPHDF